MSNMWYSDLNSAVNESTIQQIILSRPHFYERKGKREIAYTYSTFSSYEKVEAFIRKQRRNDKIFHEVKVKDGMYKLHLDIDIKLNTKDPNILSDCIQTLRAPINESLIICFPDNFTKYFEISADQITVINSNGLCGPNEYKYSAHIILPWYGFNSHCRYFNESVKSLCPPEFATFVDDKITMGENKSLRAPGCAKLTDIENGYGRWFSETAPFETALLTVLNGKFDDEYNISTNYVPGGIIKASGDSRIQLTNGDIAMLHRIYPHIEIDKKGNGTFIDNGNCDGCWDIHSPGVEVDYDYSGGFDCCFYKKVDYNKTIISMKCHVNGLTNHEIYSYIEANNFNRPDIWIRMYKNLHIGPADIHNRKCKIAIQDFYTIFPSHLPTTAGAVLNFMKQTLAIIDDGSSTDKIISKKLIVEKIDNGEEFIRLAFDRSTLADYKKKMFNYSFMVTEIVKDKNGDDVEIEKRHNMADLITIFRQMGHYLDIAHTPVSPDGMENLRIRKTFNMYTGAIAYDRMDEIADLTVGDCEQIIRPILNHMFEVFCRNNDAEYKFLIAWLKQHIKRPYDKTGKFLIFSGTFGCGKSSFWEWFSRFVIGDNLSYCTKIDNVVRKFNALVENRKLIVCEEMKSHQGTKYLDELKHIITNTFGQEIENKNLDPHKTQNFCDYVSNTNYVDSIRLDKGQRRIKIFDCSDKYSPDVVGEAESHKYFEMFYENCEIMGACFYKWLWKSDESPEDMLGNLEIPYNEMMNRLLQESVPMIGEFVKYLYELFRENKNFGNTNVVMTWSCYTEWFDDGRNNKKFQFNKKGLKQKLDEIGFVQGKLTDKFSGKRVQCFPFNEPEMRKYLTPYVNVEWFDDDE